MSLSYHYQCNSVSLQWPMGPRVVNNKPRYENRMQKTNQHFKNKSLAFNPIKIMAFFFLPPPALKTLSEILMFPLT